MKVYYWSDDSIFLVILRILERDKYQLVTHQKLSQIKVKEKKFKVQVHTSETFQLVYMVYWNSLEIYQVDLKGILIRYNKSDLMKYKINCFGSILLKDHLDQVRVRIKTRYDLEPEWPNRLKTQILTGVSLIVFLFIFKKIF